MIDESVPTTQTIETQETTEQGQVAEISPPAKPTNPDIERNLVNLRQAKDRAERERDEAIRILKESESRKPIEPEEDLSIHMNPDDLAEGKHISKLEKKYKKLEAEVAQYQRQSNESLIEARLKSQYTDFDTVVSAANIKLLSEQYPELAQTINSSPDLYSKAVSAYTLIKKFGVDQGDPYAGDKQRVQENLAKPKPLAAVSQAGESSLSQANAFANGLTKDLRSKLLDEMKMARKGY